MALNHFGVHNLSLQKTGSDVLKIWYFSYRAFWSKIKLMNSENNAQANQQIALDTMR